MYTILDLSKFKAFTVSISNLRIYEKMENIEAKGETAGNQHFLWPPQCFQRPSFSKSSIFGIVR